MDTAVAGVMHAAPVAHALVAHPGNEGLHIPVPTAVAEPILQQQAEVGRVSYDTDDNNAEQQHGTGAYRSSALLGRKHAPDRRPLRFWQPFNDWWRAELDRMGRRPTSHDIGEWWVAMVTPSRSCCCAGVVAKSDCTTLNMPHTEIQGHMSSGSQWLQHSVCDMAFADVACYLDVLQQVCAVSRLCMGRVQAYIAGDTCTCQMPPQLATC